MKAKAHRLGGLLEWGAERAAKSGFGGLTVACEPTGHRWKALMGLADAAGHGFVCVQSMAVHRARETDDYTLGKTDHRDAYLIGKLVTRLECYLPERADERCRRRSWKLMLTILIFVVGPVAVLVVLLLVIVVIGIRQEPSTEELSQFAPSPIAAFVRRLLGLYVGKPYSPPSRNHGDNGHASLPTAPSPAQSATWRR